MIDLENYRLKTLKYNISAHALIEIDLESIEDTNVFIFNDEELKKIKKLLKEYDKLKEKSSN